MGAVGVFLNKKMVQTWQNIGSLAKKGIRIYCFKKILKYVLKLQTFLLLSNF